MAPSLSNSNTALVAPGMEELDWNGEAFRSASIPAANGMFTARALARLYACLAAGGELDGVRLLSEGAVRRASQEQNRGIGRVVPVSMRWRLGYHRVFAVKQGLVSTLIVTVNSGVGTPFGDSRIARVAGAAARCADRRELR